MKKILLSSLVVSSLVLAGEMNFDESNKLITHTEFGYISTSGNTQTKTYALESKIDKGFDKHIFAVTFDGQFAEDHNIETKNKYYLELTYNYQLTDKLSLNYLAGYKDDKFSGYNYQLYTGPGATYKAIEFTNHNLSIDSNILYSKDKFDDIDYDLNGDSISYPNADNLVAVATTKGATENYTSFKLKAAYKWQILDDLKFTQDTSYRTDIKDIDNYFITSKTAFSSKISDIFSAGISYKIDYTNLQAEGKKSADKTLTANLTVDY